MGGLYNPYDVETHLTQDGHAFAYNTGVGLRRWKSHLAAVQTSTDKIINLNVIGTSVACGGITTNYITKGWVGLVRAALATKYGDVGRGVIPEFEIYNTGGGDTALWTWVGTWTTQTGFGIQNESKLSTVAASTATVAFNGTGVSILVYKGPACGKFLVTVDGGAPVEFNSYAASAVPCFAFTVSDLEAGDHTLVITQNEEGKYTLLLGILPLKGTVGVRINACAKLGASTSWPGVNENVYTSMIDYWTPALTIIEYFTNDYFNQTALATYKASMQTLITRAKLYGDVLLLPVGVRDGTNTITQLQYINTLKDLAKENDIVLLDMWHRWGGTFNSADVTLDFVSDTVHPNDKGHRDIANFVLKTLVEY